MGLYDRVADLPLSVTGYDLDRRVADTSSGFERVTTVVALRGDGSVGRGEDVTYDAVDHERFRDHHDLSLAGEYTVAEFSATLDGTDLFPGGPPERESARHYRRWAFESAALELALRQADTDLGTVLGESYDPVSFVVSTRLGDPPSADRVRRWLDADPDLTFKLDPTADWDDALVETLASTGAVRICDLKGHYEGTSVDNPPDPALYRRVIEGFPDAVVEDPALTDATRPVLDGAEDRVSWDAPITGVESVRSLPWAPRWLNVKPSRFGTVRSLLDTVDYVRERGVRLYGGGQFELGVGRDQIQALASLLYPDGPNDVAPRGYNAPEVRTGLPGSPLAPPESPTGFGW
ncbi:MAG: hypothetical protein ABEJ70_05685 [Halobacteriaceae archaeon]